ncbi:unnamed protein product [Peronospora destructor]|uniref:protein acetyllysine N-acetyltransferase n=1 Tax=Peronospora destructor TaxID=86335 RepID=A0AAV0V7A2_9STRA|nr:unnamed protein product [Peronospora destructor]
MLTASAKRCRAPSDGEDYLPAAHNYQLAPMKALLRAARRDFYLPSVSSITSKDPDDEVWLLQVPGSALLSVFQIIVESTAFVARLGIKSNLPPKDRRKTGENQDENSEDDKIKDQTEIEVLDFTSLVPSVTHMALQELHRLGFLKHIVSQNVDNLHLKSGIPATALTEVHGNATQAKCETCEKIYVKEFPWTGLCDDPECVSTKRSVEQRLRARTRHGNGRLKRNVVGFDEPLGDIDFAIDECEAADVALVLGTSLRVEPFSEMAGDYAGSLCIVNLQPTTTKLDRRAEETGVRVFEKTDVVMEKTMQFLMKDFTYRVPKWTGEHSKSVFVPEHESSNLVNVLAGRTLS